MLMITTTAVAHKSKYVGQTDTILHVRKFIWKNTPLESSYIMIEQHTRASFAYT